MNLAPESEQLQEARALAGNARALAHRIGDLRHPQESYEILGELHDTANRMADISRRLSRWTTNSTHGFHHEGYDPGEGDALAKSASALKDAATALSTASNVLMRAQGENSRIRWRGNLATIDWQAS